MNKLVMGLIIMVCCYGFALGEDSAPSVWYEPTNDGFTGDIIIRTVEIPYETLYTYYSTINWNAGMDGGGYCGLQAQAAGHEYHFSLWDPSNHQAITAPYTSPGTTVQSFGGEGTGLKAMNLTLGWNNGQWYSTAVRCWNVGDHTYFGYWIHDHSGDKWTHMITMDFPMPNIRFSTGNGGFIEDWLGTGSNIRRYHITASSKRDLSGTWYGMSQCRITANPNTGGTYDWNFNGGIENDYYFVESGGNSVPSDAFGGGRSATFNKPQPDDPQDPIIAFSITIAETDKVLWDVPVSSTPQFGYTIKVNGIEVMSAIEPEARSASISANVGDTLELILEDILGRTAAASAQIYQIGDFDSDGDVDAGDLGTLGLHWLEQDCNYPDWCEGTDLDYNGYINFPDFAIFANNWLWCRADLDSDGAVNFTDYAIFAYNWMDQNCAEPNWCEGTDFDHSGSVDMLDLATFARYWLEDI